MRQVPAWALPLVLSMLAAVLSLTQGEATAGPVRLAYRPPVDAPIIDPFRPPSSPWRPGNRGIDYSTKAGTEVRAAAPGLVTFAGPVGGGLHVVVLHPDGVRTSYSFLASVAVVRGEGVEAGQVVGTSGRTLHFGARVGGEYIDPLLLLAGGGGGRARLVRDDQGASRLATHEPAALRRLVRPFAPVNPVPAASVAWARSGSGPVP